MADNAHYAGAVYLGGYALECLLKVVICRRLELERLLTTFHSHDLEALLHHCGLMRRMEREPGVRESFVKASGVWKVESGADSVRYQAPEGFGEDDWQAFSAWLNHEDRGVMRWLRTQVSRM